eukprot:SAG31_NODE_1158_length_9605_cov_2.788555_11_plen_139_part_00
MYVVDVYLDVLSLPVPRTIVRTPRYCPATNVPTLTGLRSLFAAALQAALGGRAGHLPADQIAMAAPPRPTEAWIAELEAKIDLAFQLAHERYGGGADHQEDTGAAGGQVGAATLPGSLCALFFVPASRYATPYIYISG